MSYARRFQGETENSSQASTSIEKTSRATGGFTLTELLAVVAIIALVATLSQPAFQAIAGAGSVSKAAADASQIHEMARVYAMSHNTFVRIGYSEIVDGPSAGSTLVAAIYSASGDSADAVDGPNGSRNWPLMSKPVIIRNFSIDDDLNSSATYTEDDSTPSESDIVSFTRNAGDFGSRSFHSVVQYTPSGEPRVYQGQPSRYIKIGWASSRAMHVKNERFIVRLQGMSGAVRILRSEDL